VGKAELPVFLSVHTSESGESKVFKCFTSLSNKYNVFHLLLSKRAFSTKTVWFWIDITVLDNNIWTLLWRYYVKWYLRSIYMIGNVTNTQNGINQRLACRFITHCNQPISFLILLSILAFTPREISIILQSVAIAIQFESTEFRESFASSSIVCSVMPLAHDSWLSILKEPWSMVWTYATRYVKLYLGLLAFISSLYLFN